MKTYEEIQTGNKAFNACYQDDYEGEVLWKGTYAELKKSIYADTAMDWEGFEDETDFDDYDLVVIDTDWGPVLFNYDNDPCGVICFKD